MAKAKTKSTKEDGLFPETQAIAALLCKEAEQDVVVLVVPSHDRNNRLLSEAQTGEWASNALKLMADLYVGGTAFRAEFGIYKTNEGHYLLDKPLVIESFATHEAMQDPVRLNLLVEFSKRMGKALDQASIMIALGGVMYYIEDYAGV